MRLCVGNKEIITWKAGRSTFGKSKNEYNQQRKVGEDGVNSQRTISENAQWLLVERTIKQQFIFTNLLWHYWFSNTPEAWIGFHHYLNAIRKPKQHQWYSSANNNNRSKVLAQLSASLTLLLYPAQCLQLTASPSAVTSYSYNFTIAFQFNTLTFTVSPTFSELVLAQ